MVFLFFSFLFSSPLPFTSRYLKRGREFRFAWYHRGGFSTILRYFIYTAITKSRTFRWLVWPRSRSHSASLSSNASEKPEGGSSLGTNRFPDPSRSWSRLEQELLDWCLGLPNPEIGPKLERVSSLVWRASCNILDLPLPGNDFLSKIGEGSVDVLDSGPWYRKSLVIEECRLWTDGDRDRRRSEEAPRNYIDYHPLVVRSPLAGRWRTDRCPPSILEFFPRYPSRV